MNIFSRSQSHLVDSPRADGIIRSNSDLPWKSQLKSVTRLVFHVEMCGNLAVAVAAVSQRLIRESPVADLKLAVQVEGRSSFEHVFRVCGLVDLPVVQRLVERRGAGDRAHIRDIIEPASRLAHIRDVVDPPVVQRLVERRGAGAEHPVHTRDVVDPPVVQRFG